MVQNPLDFETFSGFSGSPVLSLEERFCSEPAMRFCGIAIAGTPASGRVFFLEAEVVADLLRVSIRRLKKFGLEATSNSCTVAWMLDIPRYRPGSNAWELSTRILSKSTSLLSSGYARIYTGDNSRFKTSCQVNHSPNLDPTRCPICSQPNRCAMEVARETGVKQDACWCTQVDFSADLLARVPASAQRQACICAACAAKQVSSPPAPPAAP